MSTLNEKEERKNAIARHELADEITGFKKQMTDDKLFNLCEIADETLSQLTTKNLTIAEIIVIADYIQTLTLITEL